MDINLKLKKNKNAMNKIQLDTNKVIGSSIKSIRLFRCVSSKELARCICVSHQVINKYERGEDGLSIFCFIKIAMKLRVPCSIFFQQKKDIMKYLISNK